MTIKRGNKGLFPYLGDYRPINIYKGETKLAGWKWQSDSGKVLQFQNGYKDVVHVGVDGLSVQNAGSGKNLYIGGTSLPYTANANNTFKRTSLKAGVYTFSIKELKSVTKFRMLFWLYKNGQLIFETSQLSTHIQVSPTGVYANITSGAYMFNADNWAMKYTVTLDSDYEIFWSFFGGDSTATSEMLYPQIELGTTATTYEPPAPSPDNPIAINSLDKIFDIVSSVGKENLVKKTNISWSRATSVSNDVLYYQSINGSSPYIVWDSRPLLKSGVTYSFSMKWKRPKQSTSGGAIRLISYNATITYLANIPSAIPTGEWEELVYVYTPTSDTLFGVQLYMSTGTPLTEAWVKDLKIEEGEKTIYSQAPEDIPYDTQSPTIYKTNILLSEPLRSVGDVKDRLFLDSDGLWKVERNVGEVIFDGSADEGWIMGGTGWKQDGETNVFYTYTALNKAVNTASLSSHFKTTIGGGIVKADTEEASSGNGLWLAIRINKSKLSIENSVGWNLWLAKNPVTNQYPLLKSTIETLPAEQQTKLNNIQSFKGSNYVYTMAGVVPNLNGKMKVKEI